MEINLTAKFVDAIIPNGNNYNRIDGKTKE